MSLIIWAISIFFGVAATGLIVIDAMFVGDPWVITQPEVIIALASVSICNYFMSVGFRDNR